MVLQTSSVDTFNVLEVQLTNSACRFVICDNASANNVMIDHLAILLEAFPGLANHTRCFTHILNLVAKCIMKQFDAPKKKEKKR